MMLSLECIEIMSKYDECFKKLDAYNAGKLWEDGK